MSSRHLYEIVQIINMIHTEYVSNWRKSTILPATVHPSQIWPCSFHPHCSVQSRRRTNGKMSSFHGWPALCPFCWRFLGCQLLSHCYSRNCYCCQSSCCSLHCTKCKFSEISIACCPSFLESNLCHSNEKWQALCGVKSRITTLLLKQVMHVKKSTSKWLIVW